MNKPTAFILSTLMMTSLFIPPEAQAATDDDWQAVIPDLCEDITLKQPDKTEPAEADVDDTATPAPDGAPAFLIEATKEYKVAKIIFDRFTKEYGTSGDFASGALANAWAESRMIPNISQSDGPMYKFPMDGKTPDGNFGGGGGLFQFTPYQKFTDSKYWGMNGGDGWEPENQVDAVWGLEFGNRAIEAFLPNANSPYKTVEDFISSDDPREAARSFMMAYERPAHFQAERADYAELAAKVFNSPKVKANPSKFKIGSGASADDIPAVSETDLKDTDELSDIVKKDANGCEVAPEQSEKKRSGSGLFALEGTGEHNHPGGNWRYDDVPKELQKYMLDPELVDMKYGDNTNWFDQGHGYERPWGSQCTHLSSSLFARVWTTDGKKVLADEETDHGACQWGMPCNGRDLAGVWDKSPIVSGDVSKEAHTGALASVDIPGTPYGHTYIVSHVFKNGDIMIVEQNWNHTGNGGGKATSYTWEYRIIEKATYKGEGTTFFYPDQDKFQPNDAYAKK